MIELDKHIEILLLDNDCVIVPDFGGFMAYHADAKYDKEEGIFLPPLRTVGFNPQLTMNDSLLVQSYIEAYDISYPEALRRIEDEVAEIKQTLDNEGCFELNDIGMMRLNESGYIEFEPCEAGILTPELYGLNSVGFKMLADEEPVTAEIPVKKEENKSVLTPQNEVFTSTDDADSDKTISIKVSVLRNIAAACIAVIAFFAIATPLGNNKTASLIKGNIDTGLLDRIIPKDVVAARTPVKYISSKEESMMKVPAAKGAVNTNKKNNTAEEIKDKPYYTIVLASKVTRRNAVEYAGKLNRKGYDQAKVLTKKHNTKVVYGHYKTESSAYHVLNKLNDNEEFADGWVTKINN